MARSPDVDRPSPDGGGDGIELDFTLCQGAFTLEIHERIRPGSVALFGPSGSGKTTVLEAIAGLRRPDRGRIRVGSRVLYCSTGGVDLPPRDRRVGYVPQDLALFPHMSVRRNVSYAGSRGRVGELGRIVDLLELEPLMASSVQRLSGGERQRVAIARALMASPDVVLLDEPLTGLDAALRDRILPFLARVRDELGIPVVYVSHNVDEIRSLVDWVLILREGRVVASGASSTLATDGLGQSSRGWPLPVSCDEAR